MSMQLKQVSISTGTLCTSWPAGISEDLVDPAMYLDTVCAQNRCTFSNLICKHGHDGQNDV